MSGVLVFVYGTLRQGECRFGLPSLMSVVHDEAYLDGYEMLNIADSYPGLVPGEGRIRGEIHLFADLNELDAIEGYSARFPERSLFRRQVVVTELPNGETVEATTYYFNGQESWPKIASGDWVAAGL